MVDLSLVQDPSFPFSCEITELGLLSTEENGIIFARRKYNQHKRSFNLHYNSLSVKEFEILSCFYQTECAYGARCFYWRYPLFDEHNKSYDVGNIYQGKIFYVRTTKFSFKAITFNSYRGDIVLTEV